RRCRHAPSRSRPSTKPTTVRRPLRASRGGSQARHPMESIISTFLIGLGLGTQYALISIGFTLIFGILGVINFAHGGFYILGGYVAYTVSHTLGLNYVLAVAVATVATAALGYIVEYIVVDRYVNDHLATMILTLGVYLV